MEEERNYKEIDDSWGKWWREPSSSDSSDSEEPWPSPNVAWTLPVDQKEENMERNAAQGFVHDLLVPSPSSYSTPQRSGKMKRAGGASKNRARFPVETGVRKHFPGYGTYNGKIIELRPDRYLVEYTDGDKEEYLFGEKNGKELQTIVDAYNKYSSSNARKAATASNKSKATHARGKRKKAPAKIVKEETESECGSIISSSDSSSEPWPSPVADLPVAKKSGNRKRKNPPHPNKGPVKRGKMKRAGGASKAGTHFTVGTGVRKLFTGYGTFDGQIVKLDTDRYLVEYTDGDQEEYLFRENQGELRRLVEAYKKHRASSAAKPVATNNSKSTDTRGSQKKGSQKKAPSKRVNKKGTSGTGKATASSNYQSKKTSPGTATKKQNAPDKAVPSNIPVKQNTPFVREALAHGTYEATNTTEEETKVVDEKELKLSIGTPVRKHFPGQGWFNGIIVRVEKDRCRVRYVDCDEEEYLFGTGRDQLAEIVASAAQYNFADQQSQE